MKNVSCRKFALLLLLTVFMHNAFSQTRKVNNSYNAGEILNYDIRYGIFLGGKAVMEVNNARFKGEDVLHLKVTGKSAGILSAVYNIKDVYESFVDPDTDLPVKAIRNIREGRYRRYNEAYFNRKDTTVFSTRKKNTVKVKPNAHDILSAFYYAREYYFNDNMQVNDSIVLETFFSEEPFTLRILYKGTDIVKTKFGKVKCYKFIPLVETGRVFRENDDLIVWISADKNRIPIKIRFDIVIGSLICELDSFGGLSNSFNIIPD